MNERTDWEQRARVFMALAEPTRLQIIELLSKEQELSTSEAAERLGISLPLACHHMKLLCEAGLVDKRKEGQTKYISLNRALLDAALTSFRSTLAPVVQGSAPSGP